MGAWSQHSNEGPKEQTVGKSKGDDLSDAEYAEMQENQRKLRAAHEANPEAVEAALKDFVDFPPKSGDLTD